MSTETVTYTPIFFLHDIFPVYSSYGMTDEQTQKMVESIHELGYQVFYLLANETNSQEIKNKNNTKSFITSKKPRLLKCTNNIVAKSITEVSDENIPLGGIKTHAYYNLPKMSKEFISNLDNFFRYVHKKYGTEAIVIFTYDSTFENSDNPSDGWGIAVPKQENTSVSCDYDQQSILEALPDEYDHIFQVGTAHSHPMMDAYCSGTDKADQASFDGIHITFGWKGPVTEHHIELQMGDTQFSLRIDQVFDFEVDEVNDTVKSWAANVTQKKAVQAYSQYTGYSSSGNHQLGSSSFLTQAQVEKKVKDYLPSDVPSGKDTTIIYSPIMPRDELDECPVCESSLNITSTKSKGRCYRCMCYIMNQEEKLEDFINFRECQIAKSSAEIDPSKKPHRSIWLVEEDYDSDGTEVFMYSILYLSDKDKNKGFEGQKIAGRLGGSDDFSKNASIEKNDEINALMNEVDDTIDETIFDHVVCLDCGAKNDLANWECDMCNSFNFSAPGLPSDGHRSKLDSDFI